VTLGVLALQGDITPHVQAIERLGHRAVRVRYPEDLARLEALVLPGGESTTIGMLLERWGLTEPLKHRVAEGLPVWGTCAGAILLARRIEGTQQPTLGLIDIVVRRNAYGRQVDSFEAPLTIRGLDEPVNGVFIRAPIITEVGAGVEVLGTHEGGVVAAASPGLFVTTFHPELTEDTRVLELFLERGAQR